MNEIKIKNLIAYAREKLELSSRDSEYKSILLLGV